MANINGYDDLDRQDLKDDITEITDGYYAFVRMLTAASVIPQDIQNGVKVINTALASKGDIAKSKI
jgi:hypothetical protein